MEKKEVKRKGLPPLVSKFDKNGVVWKRLEKVDHDLLGYLLSCHLVIEHYMDNFLLLNVSQKLSWKAAQLSFSQKVRLLSDDNRFKHPWDFIPAIAELNKLRNRFVHDIDIKLQVEDLKPISASIAKMSENENKNLNDPSDILEQFTFLVCSWFAGYIAGATEK
ncbi:hypothetical protein E3V55_00350 [Candidatus Marinimicrobia bacterium MT.SAG.3]|nr:hypothetical protein E3V55_00350 [Candidatus Marinimicrobia bacterium MT.SAG.3]